MSDQTLYRIDPVVSSLRSPYRIVRQANEIGDPVVGQLVPVEPEMIVDAHEDEFYNVWEVVSIVDGPGVYAIVRLEDDDE